jgi:hypothetical protein
MRLRCRMNWLGMAVEPDVCESLGLARLLSRTRPLSRVVLAMREGCGLIADGQACTNQPLEDPPRLR